MKVMTLTSSAKLTLLGHLLAPSKLRGGWERGKESLRSWDIETKAYLNEYCAAPALD